MSGERFRQARELRGLTQKELAERIGVTQPQIAAVESGVAHPSDALLRAVSFKAGFPMSHFRQPAPPEFTFGSLLFRSRTAMPARERRIAYRYGQIAFEIFDKLSKRLRMPLLRLPRIEEPPQQAAKIMRSSLGLAPDTPVGKLINVLERHGVILLASPARATSHDAFSLWAGPNLERAVIIIVATLSGDRLRYSVAHELRHVSCTARGSKKDIERDADVFAAEFLMPEEIMREELVAPVTITKLSSLKQRWGTSIQALVRRAFDLGVITARQYEYLMQQMSSRGWRKKEPVEIPAERPRALRQIAEMLYGNPIDYVRLATDVSLSTALVKDVIELHAGKQPKEVVTRPLAPVLPIRSG